MPFSMPMNSTFACQSASDISPQRRESSTFFHSSELRLTAWIPLLKSLSASPVGLPNSCQKAYTAASGLTCENAERFPPHTCDGFDRTFVQDHEVITAHDVVHVDHDQRQGRLPLLRLNEINRRDLARQPLLRGDQLHHRLRSTAGRIIDLDTEL